MATKKLQILGSLISTDDTLTEQGIAADAKATGEAIQSAIEYADTKLSLDGGTMQGDIYMDGFEIVDAAGVHTSVLCLTNNADNVLVVCDEQASGITFNSSTSPAVPLSGIAYPTNNDMAANKEYVDEQRAEIDEQLANCLSLDGGTMNNADIDGVNAIWLSNLILKPDDDNEILISAINNDEVDPTDNAVVFDLTFETRTRIKNVADPVEDTDVVTKRFVNDAIAAALEEIPFAEDSTF